MTTLFQRAPRFGPLGAATMMICAATAAPADDAGKWYAGLAHNSTETTVETPYGWIIGPCTDSFDVSGGRRFSKHFALDFGLLRATGLEWQSGYVDLPQGFYRVHTVFDATALQLGAVGILPFGRIWEVSVKGGYAYADLGGRQSLRDVWLDREALVRDVDANSTRFLFAVGLGVTVAEKWQIRGEVEQFYIASSWLGVHSDTTIDSYSLGVQYRFGQRAADE